MNDQRREAVRSVAEAAVMGGRDIPEAIAYAVEAGLSWPDVQAPPPATGRPRRTRDHERSMWQDAAADLLVSGIALVRAARRAHTVGDPWVREAEAWLGRAGALTGTEREPEGLAPVRVHPNAKWSCGCSQVACDIRWQRIYVSEECGTPPLERLEARCVTHALVGTSRAFSTADVLSQTAAGRTGVQRAQALDDLNTAHEEQCR